MNHCRNLRAERVLREWAQDGDTYYSGIPKDIITCVAHYISPRLWTYLYRWENIWEEETWKNWMNGVAGQACFLPDNVVSIAGGDNYIQGINLVGETLFSLNHKTHQEVDQRTDFHGGFWTVGHTGYRLVSFLHFDPTREKEEEISYPVHDCLPTGIGWSYNDYFFDEDGYCYIIMDSSNKSLLVKFNPDRVPIGVYSWDRMIGRIKYRHQYLYIRCPHNILFKVHRMALTAEPEAEHLLTPRMLNTTRLIKLPSVSIKEKSQRDFLPHDFYDHHGDIYTLFPDRVMLSSPVGKMTMHVQLVQWPLKERGLNFTMNSRGELLVLTFTESSEINRTNLYRLY